MDMETNNLMSDGRQILEYLYRYTACNLNYCKKLLIAAYIHIIALLSEGQLSLGPIQLIQNRNQNIVYSNPYAVTPLQP